MITNKWLFGEQDIEDALAVRRQVFVEEQGTDAATEHDRTDTYAMHLVLYDDGLPVATGRIYYAKGGFSIGRVCVLKEFRNKNIGDLLVRLLLWKTFQFTDKVLVGAQNTVVLFYERYGFCRIGAEYVEENIVHTPMQVTKDTVLFPSDCARDAAIEMIRRDSGDPDHA